MSKVVASIFVTLDGVMEAPAEWSGSYWNDEADKFATDQLFASDALLLGRKTYEEFVQAWPSAPEDEKGFTARINNMPKYVVTSTKDELEWNAQPVKGDIVQEIKKLKEKPGGDLLVFGSADLVQTLLENDLLDELRLWVNPVVVGHGKKLFKDAAPQKTLALTGNKDLGSGSIILSYQPAASA